ncbi:MAG: DUF4169 family protein [Rhodobacteraceae bacterium]|nr:DUF4169 family protein [Paracoccaceae bacterium]
MAKPVNLNRFRKQKARAKGRARADENAAVFGLRKVEKDQDAAVLAKVIRDLDGHEVER